MSIAPELERELDGTPELRELQTSKRKRTRPEPEMADIQEMYQLLQPTFARFQQIGRASCRERV